MPAYFGQQTTTYGTENPGAAWDRNYNTVFTCPGSGKQQVKEISMYARQTSGPANLRLAIYDHSNNLIAEGAAEVAVSSTAGWQGHLSPSVIKPAGGSAGDPVLLDGGTNYRIAVTCDGKIWFYSDKSLGFSDDWRQQGGTEYTDSGWPDPLAHASNQDYGNWAVRVGVDPYLIKVVDETGQTSEGVERRSSMTRPLDETGQVSESVTRRSVLRRVLDETQQIGEGVLKYIASTLVRMINESVTISESVLRRIFLGRIAAETMQVVENILRSRTMVRVLAEGVNIVGAVVKSISIAISRTINESLSIFESASGIRGIITILNESLSIAESLVSKIALSAEKLIRALRRIFIVDTERRVFIVDTSYRAFMLDTERRVFYVH